MPNATDDTDSAEQAQPRDTRHLLAHIKMDDDDPRDWAGPGARLWVNNNDGETVLDIRLGSSPRREAIARLHVAGYTLVEVVAPTLFVVQKR